MSDPRALLHACPVTPEEIPHREAMLTLLEQEPRCFHRDAFPAHFTGSALVVSAEGEEVLLHHHRKLDCWMQFGGHCDGEADLLQVARREAWEESGIAGLEPVFPIPLDLDIHPIPERPTEPVHFHYDVRFLFRAPHGARFRVSGESVALRWFRWAETDALALDPGLRRLIRKASP